MCRLLLQHGSFMFQVRRSFTELAFFNSSSFKIRLICYFRGRGSDAYLARWTMVWTGSENYISLNVIVLYQHGLTGWMGPDTGAKGQGTVNISYWKVKRLQIDTKQLLSLKTTTKRHKTTTKTQKIKTKTQNYFKERHKMTKKHTKWYTKLTMRWKTATNTHKMTT